MKRDENETLCWIMRWGWMTRKRSLAFNNDDGKTLYKKTTTIKSIYTKKLKNKNFNLLPILPVFFGPCPCNVPWNGNQKIRAIFQLLTRSAFGNLLTDFNMHWLHSELYTIIYTDLSLAALSTHLSCLSLFLPSLFSFSAFNLSSSSSFSLLFHSTLQWLY